MNQQISFLLDKYKINKNSQGFSKDTIDRVVLNMAMLVTDTKIFTLDELNTDLIINWGNIKLETIRLSSLSAYYNSIRSFLTFINSIGLKHKVDISKITCKYNHRQKQWLRPGQIRHIMRYAEPDIVILIRLLFTTGMRISEALSINNNHLQDETTIYIRAKGGKTRPVFITKEIYSQLHILSTRNGGFCFVHNGHQMDRKQAYNKIKRACILAGYPKASPHTMRHSFITELIRKNVNLSQVQRLAGHSSIQTTQIYEHLIVDDIEKAHKAITII